VSDSAIIVCEISVTAGEATARAEALRGWLLARGLVVPNQACGSVMHPSDFRPGPTAVDVVREPAVPWMERANNGVDIVCARVVHHPLENYEPPTCPACGAEGEEAMDALEPWLEGEEPCLDCAACGRSYLLGDAAGWFNAYVAEIAVRFNNWPGLTASFIEDLGELLGPRCRVVYEHL
jgi:hypothetical protein